MNCVGNGAVSSVVSALEERERVRLEALEARMMELVAKCTGHERSALAESTIPGEPALAELNTLERGHRGPPAEEPTVRARPGPMVELAELERLRRAQQVTGSTALVSPSTVPSVVPPSAAGIGVGSRTLGAMTMLDGVI